MCAGTITATRFNEPGVPTLTPAVAPTAGPTKQKWYSYNYGEACIGIHPRGHCNFLKPLGEEWVRIMRKPC
jgi:hypothetical protein